MEPLSNIHISSEVSSAISIGTPVVALESAVITHGLPIPVNFELAIELEEIIRGKEVVPATIAMINGKIHVGLSHDMLVYLANIKNSRKISARDFGFAIQEKLTGGTTVAGTLIAAHLAGIRVFATGGIGGVHRGSPLDISADLHILSHYPLIVVCSGAKSILDLPATREVLESLGVPVLGYKTNEFPAFYSPISGLQVDLRVESPSQVSEIANSHWGLGLQTSVLVAQPPPDYPSLKVDEIESIIKEATNDAQIQNIHGAALTPWLLSEIAKNTQGRSLEINLALLRNNAKLAAEIAKSFCKR